MNFRSPVSSLTPEKTVASATLDRRIAARRTVIALVIVAVVIYCGFILMMMWR